MHFCSATVQFNYGIFFYVSSLDALILRFEAPDSRNRWDSPLFTIQKEERLPFETISDAILKRKVPPPNQSTQSVRSFLVFLYISIYLI